ncbi:MAG: DUF2017 family protein [Microthrixaceae bacterium]
MSDGIDRAPSDDRPWFTSEGADPADSDPGDSDLGDSDPGDNGPGDNGPDDHLTAPVGTVLVWSDWARHDRIPARLGQAVADLARRLAGDMPKLSHRNPDGQELFDHDELLAVLGDALGEVAELCRRDWLTDASLSGALQATHNGAIVAAVAAEATGEEAVWQAGHWLTRAGEELRNAMWRRFHPAGDGRYRLRLRRGERSLLRRALVEHRQRLLDDSPEVSRLFPAGYGDATEETTEASKEFASLTRDDLMAGRLAALDLVEGSLEERTIDGETLSAWMRTLNDVRLVLGTTLEITDDQQPPPAPWDSSFPTWRVYALLGALVHEAVLALRSEL